MSGDTHPYRVPSPAWVGIAVTAAVLLTPAQGWAQGVRGWVSTNVQAVEMRPFSLDTVPESQIVADANGFLTYQGRPASCLGGVCTTYATLGEEVTLAATQDVSVTAWGFGVQGLSFTTLLRGRARMGSDLPWPRTDDEFDALLGYAQLVRGPVRVRLGRQEIRSGLGFSAFDGANVVYTRGETRFEVYGGRSLARGLREPANEALRGLETFLTDQGVHLIGVSAETHLKATVATARYQREVFADRTGLVSERASVDVFTPLPGARLTGSLDYDFGLQRLGKSRVSLALPFANGRWLLEASARRYVPYFELSTIWGFFEPVSYSELELRAGWSPSSAFGVWASGGRRAYEDAGATVVLQPLTDDGWRANAGVRWQLTPSWSASGAYRLEWGPGAFLSSGDVSVRWARSERLSLSATATSFQQIEEFRLGDGRALGAGASFELRLTPRIDLTGGGSLLRQSGDDNTVFDERWNQMRAWTSFRIGVGSDPGLAALRHR